MLIPLSTAQKIKDHFTLVFADAYLLDVISTQAIFKIW